MDRTPAEILARAAATLTAALLAPAAVALLRLFPPLSLAEPGAPSWLAIWLAAFTALVLGGAATLRLIEAFRTGGGASMFESASLGSLAVGLAAGAFHALGAPTDFPDGGLPLAMAAAGVLLLIPRLLPAFVLSQRGRQVAFVLLAISVEGVLAASLFAPVPEMLAPWLTAGAAALAAAAAVPGPMLGAGLLAGSFAAMTAVRPGALDAAFPLTAMMAAAVAFSWPRSRAEEADLSQPIILAPAAPPAPPLAAVTPAKLPPMDEEALRLARELRGTIEELLQARRTVELQRDELARTATHDPLTGVASRRSILERLAIEAGESRRYEHPVAVMLLDVDDFSEINRANGFTIGDAVLRELALRLRLRMRAADALGRVGGDSFMAILPHTDERGAAVFADALRRRLITRPIDTDAGEMTISISIGVAFMRPGMELSADELLAAADEALESAQAAGGNRIGFDRRHGLVRLEERRPEAGRTREEAPGG
ncbi:MAG TPA: GGDEF domain-containing protein [Candidatus Limnocylindria bacterium]